MIPKLKRHLNGKTDGAFTSSTIKFLEHFFGHLEYDVKVRCEEFPRFMDDFPPLGEICPVRGCA
jgi:hypothetical protein